MGRSGDVKTTTTEIFLGSFPKDCDTAGNAELDVVGYWFNQFNRFIHVALVGCLMRIYFVDLRGTDTTTPVHRTESNSDNLHNVNKVHMLCLAHSDMGCSFTSVDPKLLSRLVAPLQHKTRDCTPNIDLTASGLLATATSCPQRELLRPGEDATWK